MKGVYLHNEGSMTLGIFDAKLRQGYFNAIRAMHKTKKRSEKLNIVRLVDNASIVDKLKKYNFIDEINVTFTTLTAKKIISAALIKNIRKAYKLK